MSKEINEYVEQDYLTIWKNKAVNRFMTEDGLTKEDAEKKYEELCQTDVSAIKDSFEKNVIIPHKKWLEGNDDEV